MINMKGGGRGSPCLRPFLHRIQGPGEPFSVIAMLLEFSRASIHAIHLSENPLVRRIGRREGQQTESKALLKSSSMTIIGDFEVPSKMEWSPLLVVG